MARWPSVETDPRAEGDLAAHVAAGDPHAQYQKESEKAQANGYASLDDAGQVPAGQLGNAPDPDLSGYATTGDLAAEGAARENDLADHLAAPDPHTQYQKESEKAQANGYASLDGAGQVPLGQLGNAPDPDLSGYATTGDLDAEGTARSDADSALTAAVADAQASANAALPKAGGTMTGPIVLAGDPVANLQPATRQYVLAQIAALINGAPGALDTLKEIADQLAADESAASALASTVAGKLAAANNLSDLLNAATARTNLGLGSAATHPAADFDSAGAAAAAQATSQPLDSDLSAIAALSTTAFGRGLLAAVDAAAVRTSIGLGSAATHPVTDFDTAGAAAAAQAASQPLDSDLTAIAALSTTAFGRSLLASADAPAVRTAIAAASQAALDQEVTDRAAAINLQIAKSIGTAKGDIIGFSGSGTPVRKAVGANGTFLGADSAQGDGLAYATPHAPGELGPNVVAPFHPAHANGAISTGFANGALGCRVIVPKSGQLRDLTIFLGASSGNICVGVYDTGDAAAGFRTRLYTTGSIACPAANGWRIVGDPNIAVVAGQQLEFLFAADNITATIARAAAVIGDLNLPAGFWPAAGGASPKLGVRPTSGMMPLPTTITEANMVSIGTVPMIMARIS